MRICECYRREYDRTPRSRNVESVWNNFWPTCWSRWGDASDSTGVGLCARPVVGRRAQIDRADGGAPARGKRAGDAAVDRTESLALGAGMAALGKRMTAELSPIRCGSSTTRAFAKQGHHSVGVERQYSGTLGKTANCQVAVSLHHVGEQESTILGWRLYLPESWAQDRQRRAEAGIPAEVKFQTKWQLALDIDRRGAGWGLPCGVVLATPPTGKSPNFATGWRLATFLMPWASPSTLGVWTKPPRRGSSTSLGVEERPADVFTTTASSGRCRCGRWPERPGVEASALARRHERLAGVALRGVPRPALARIRPRANRPTRRFGCWWNGRPARKSPPNTFSATCRRPTPCGGWCASSKAAGRSNRTISNSRRNWDWITTKAAIGQAGIIMSRWSCWRMPS